MARRTGVFIRFGAAAAMAAVLLTAPPQQAGAQEPAEPSPEKGYRVAQRLCSNCHLIEDKPGATLPEGVPTFRAIANRAGQTGQRITNTLIKPHTPMPDIRLSSEEIQDIIAYLDTLRTDASVPPLLPPKQGPKPQFPSRS
jgi:mono/diheme cytochrome c family protein